MANNLLCFDKTEIDNHFNINSGIPLSNQFVPIMEYPLTNHPIGIEAADSDKLLIYFVDGVIHIYDINIKQPNKSHSHHSHHSHSNDNNHNNPSIQNINSFPFITLKNYCVLAPFQTLSAHPVSLRLWNYGYDNNSNNDVIRELYFFI